MNNSPRVLIVDDNPVDTETIERFLERAGWSKESINVVHDANAAEDFCTSGSPECIILDYRLSDIDGLSLMQRIATNVNRVPVAVVILTGQGNEDVAVSAMKLGAHDYITKSNLTPERLSRAVHEAIRRRALERESREQLDSLTTFVNANSHDLRSPLTALGLNLDLLAEEVSSSGSLQNSSSLPGALHAYGQLKDLLESLHRLVSSESARFKRTVVDLHGAVQTAVRTLKPRLVAANAVVHFESLPSVIADTPVVTEVLQNLIDNAVSHNDSDNPQVRILPAVDDLDSREYAGLVVIDNGPGLSDDVRENMYAPLWRVAPTSDAARGGAARGIAARGSATREIEHSGLGLSICARLMDRIGGKILADNAPEGGARFFLLFSTALSGSLEALDPQAEVCVPNADLRGRYYDFSDRRQCG